MCKKILIRIVPVVFAIIVDIIVHTLLHKNQQLTTPSMIVVLFFCAILAYMFSEWVIFKIEWEGFKKDFNDYKMSRSYTGNILNEFAESNFLMNKISNSVKKDLQFDKTMKKDKQHLDFHLFLSKLKYNEFLPSHFIYSAGNRLISRVPTHYFEKTVWRKLVELSEKYLSIQILNCSTEKIYIENEARLVSETNFLEFQLGKTKKNAKLNSFQKLFVIEDQWIDMTTNELKNESIRKYLTWWYNKFCNSKKAKLKIIMSSQALGIINGENLDDIGIFGNILGIQSVIHNTDESFKADNVRINFYFNQTDVEKYRNDFKDIFKRSLWLKDFFNEAKDN